MFEEGGVPAGESAEPCQQDYDPQAATALAKRYGFEVVGPHDRRGRPETATDAPKS
jgi:hypothetical protein